MATETKADKPQAMWLTKDGSVNLYAGDDVADAKVNGWTETKALRGNGKPYNAPVLKDEKPQSELAAQVGKTLNERNTKRAEEEAKQAEEDRKAGEKSAAESAAKAMPPKPDFRVEIIDPKATAK